MLTVFSDTILFSKAGGVPRTVGSAVDSLNATPEKHYMQNTTTKIICNEQVSKNSDDKTKWGGQARTSVWRDDGPEIQHKAEVVNQDVEYRVTIHLCSPAVSALLPPRLLWHIPTHLL